MAKSNSGKGLHRRRQWIVHPRFQISYALVLVLLQINVGIVFQGVLHYRVRQVARESGSLKAFLSTDLWWATLPVMAVAAALVAIVVFAIGIRYSNQIVGPLPRIRRAMADLSQGQKPQRLKFRPGDVLEELAADINRLSDQLHPHDPAPGARDAASPAAPASEPKPEAEPAGV